MEPASSSTSFENHTVFCLQASRKKVWEFQNWLMMKLVPSFKLRTRHLYYEIPHLSSYSYTCYRLRLVLSAQRIGMVARKEDLRTLLPKLSLQRLMTWKVSLVEAAASYCWYPSSRVRRPRWSTIECCHFFLSLNSPN